MAFFSWQFICFLIVAVTVYYLIPGRFQWIVLLISSAWYYFVGGGPRAAVFVAVTVVTTWGGACLMDSIQKKEELKALEAAAHSSPSEEGDSGPSAGKPVKLSRAQKKELKALVQKKKRLVLTLVLLLNFGILGVLKYGSFVSTNLNSLFARFHSGTQIPVVDFILPLGISFYTFQSMGYLIDVCRGKYRAERNLFRLALFTSYFPSILQGPINRYDELASQLYTPHRFDDRRFREGILRMLEFAGGDTQDVVVFGDDTNDLDMFAPEFYKVAMGNGHPALKAVADEIAPANVKDGIYKVCSKNGWF